MTLRRATLRLRGPAVSDEPIGFALIELGASGLRLFDHEVAKINCAR